MSEGRYQRTMGLKGDEIDEMISQQMRPNQGPKGDKVSVLKV